MARIISSEVIECRDGMRSITVYDSDWCKHKENKNLCKKCNVVEEKSYRLTRAQLRRLLNIPKDFKIVGLIHGEGWPVKDGIRINTRKVKRRK